MDVLAGADGGADVLELGDLIDDVEDVEPLLAVEVALVDGVDTDEAGTSVEVGLAADADGMCTGRVLARRRAPRR
ncbi:MAG: hypothetical protein F4Z33_08245 [Gemmatimonadales bacterium]|nr:hypothetical protein [Gemmatimonadales bacterium]MYC87550.1 hypothetical protein [Candidatus Palauibacter denitrificans]